VTSSRGRATAAAPAVATLNVLDLATEDSRVWISVISPVVGDIVWGRDSRTLGYAVGQLVHLPPDEHGFPRDTVGGVTVHALDVDAPGTDLLAGRVLFRQSDASVTVDNAVMNADGRTGYGSLSPHVEDGGISMFTFGEGQPMRITRTLPPNSEVLVQESEPRYACRASVDAFGRLSDAIFNAAAGLDQCGTAYNTPN
jgi:hypothetical protein